MREKLLIEYLLFLLEFEPCEFITQTKIKLMLSFFGTSQELESCIAGRFFTTAPPGKPVSQATSCVKEDKVGVVDGCNRYKNNHKILSFQVWWRQTPSKHST